PGPHARQAREPAGHRLAAAVELIDRREGVDGEGVEAHPASGQGGEDRLGELLASPVLRDPVRVVRHDRASCGAPPECPRARAEAWASRVYLARVSAARRSGRSPRSTSARNSARTAAKWRSWPTSSVAGTTRSHPAT